ncbi:hypothetical protein Pyn_13511 [Prunus yedoensis var. nudiflora]|uniref:Uncharacterized protein n=1 Tax=Prunus yedoensis var. nudiflora TaxID=2094558 RepID=A0A314YQX4_PRUYE|nr:hypothetical protein Pyn_13511 [Prunus yedoensis var. nudiflora]
MQMWARDMSFGVTGWPIESGLIQLELYNFRGRAEAFVDCGKRKTKYMVVVVRLLTANFYSC